MAVIVPIYEPNEKLKNSVSKRNILMTVYLMKMQLWKDYRVKP